MKYLIIGLSFLTLTINAYALNGEQIFEKHSKSIIYLTNEQGGHGTGFFIHESGLIFTNKHVAEGLKNNIEGITKNNNQYKNIQIIGIHPYADVALLKAENIQPGDTHLNISNSPAKIGEDVFLIGNPEDLNFRITSGILSYKGEYLSEGAQNLQYTAPTLPGSSGSPILNREGNVIGIHSSGYKTKWGLGLDPETRKFKWETITEQGYNAGWDKIYLEEMLNNTSSKKAVVAVVEEQPKEVNNSIVSNTVEPNNDLASLIRELKAYTPPSEVRLGSK